MAFEVPDLPYPYDALEPHIDEATMHVHHDAHHKAYVDNANNALAGTEWADRSVDKVLTELDIIPEDKRTAVRNNAGGHANHSLFWTVLKGDGGAPSGDLAGAIDAAFGGLDALKQQMSDAGVNRFGSGWSWLVVNGSGELELMSTANQDSPISEGKTPIFGIDVWEHAYYLKYQNRRPDYLAAIWNVVNWDEVAERYAAARSAAAAV